MPPEYEAEGKYHATCYACNIDFADDDKIALDREIQNHFLIGPKKHMLLHLAVAMAKQGRFTV